MAHFAKLDSDNKVIDVLVLDNKEIIDENGNESEQKGIDFLSSRLGGRWIQTSYNGKFRKHFAGIGFTYDEVNDCFIPPYIVPKTNQPFPSWILKEDGSWCSPTPMPNDGKFYEWDEKNLIWFEV